MSAAQDFRQHFAPDFCSCPHSVHRNNVDVTPDLSRAISVRGEKPINQSSLAFGRGFGASRREAAIR